MSRDEIHAKFDRVCADNKISKGDRDRVRIAWSNLRAARDLSDPIVTLAAFRRDSAADCSREEACGHHRRWKPAAWLLTSVMP